MTNSRHALTLAFLAGMLAISHAQHVQATLVLNTVGGAFPTNLSLAGTAFAKDVIAGGALAPTHATINVNNGTYGNSSSWIGDSLNSFVGINFGAAPVSIGRVAWGRDNTGIGFADRTAGVYTLEYTTDPNPSELTPNSSWTTIGSVVYQTFGTLGNPNSASLRHEWSFPAVNATGIRLTAPGSSFVDGAAIDELESAAYAAAPLSLVETGGSFAPGNVAPLGTAFAKDLIGGGAFAAHNIPNINNGTYGNSSSWIGDTADSFVGIALAGSTMIHQIAFGRDNSPEGFGDRASGMYLLQYTTAASVDELTPDSSWTTLGAVYYDPADPAASLRHLYEFSSVAATGVRIFAPGASLANGSAIDEIEIYGVPEPRALLLGLVGMAGLLLLRRRRDA